MKKLFLALMVAGLVVALAAPAFANPTITGRVRWDFGYVANSQELTQNGDNDIVSGFMSVASSSFLAAEWESKDKVVGMHIEIGLGGTVTRRPVFAWYTIGNCKVVAGNNYTWMGDGVIGTASWLIDPTVGGMGLTYQGRRPMISIEWRSGDFGVQVGLFEPQMSSVGGTAVNDFRWVLPNLNVTVDAKFGSIHIAPSFGIVHYLWEADSGDDSLVAWFVALPAQISFGPVAVKLAFSYYVNGASDFGGNDLCAPVLAAGDVEDSTAYGGTLEVVFTSGAVTVVGGAAFVTIDNDTWVASDVTQYKYYAQLKYKVHENFEVIPELGFIDYGDDENNADAGSSFQLGLRFQFHF